MKIGKVLLLWGVFLLLPAISYASYGDVSTYISSIYAGDGKEELIDLVKNKAKALLKARDNTDYGAKLLAEKHSKAA